jgi:hypothetical protein
MSEELKRILGVEDPRKAFIELANYYRVCSQKEREEIQKGWGFERQWRIPGMDYSNPDRILFAPLVGVDANGLGAEERIRVRLIYHSIENARSDFRDNGMDVCLCYHAGLRAGVNVEVLFEEVAVLSQEWMAGLLRGFFRWKPEDRCLWAQGFQEVVLENEIAFEWIGSGKAYLERKPKNLDSWGREVVG